MYLCENFSNHSLKLVLVDDMLKKVKLNKMSKIRTKFTYKLLYSIKNYSNIFVRAVKRTCELDPSLLKN